MLAKILHSRFFWPILLLFLIIPTFDFLLKPGLYWNMHDDMQMVRQLEMEKCFQDGQIPCRWTPDLGYGYGYPLFNFYPPLPYLVGHLFHGFGLTYMATVKAVALTLIVLSALAMYLLASSLSGPIGAFLAALFYSYAPYHALNIYVRGAMNEAWATLFFPLIFYFSRRLIQKFSVNSLILLALSWSGLLLSHNPMALTFMLFFLPWCAYFYFEKYRSFQLKPILHMALAGFLALFLSAFFTLPVLFESKLVQIDSMFQNYYHYSVHFVSFKQLFLSNFWGDGPSVWGSIDAMSYSLNFIYWFLPILIFIYSFYKILQKKINQNTLLPFLLVILAFFATFLTHERSTFLWQLISPIQKIQFPWRFLNHSLFLFSLSIAYLPLILKNIFPKTYRLTLIPVFIGLILLNYKYFFPVTFGPITDAEKFSGLAWNNQITSGIYDYLPKTASTAAKLKAKEIIDNVEPVNTEYQLLSYQKGTDWWLFNLKNESSATFTLASLYFPDFQLYDNQQPLNYKIEPTLGRITIYLEPGIHQIYLKFNDTPIRKFSNALSLLAWIFVLFYFISQIWKSKKSIR